MLNATLRTQRLSAGYRCCRMQRRKSITLPVHLSYLQVSKQAVKLLKMISWMMTKAEFAGELVRTDSRPYPLSPIPSRIFTLCLCSKLHGISGCCKYHGVTR